MSDWGTVHLFLYIRSGDELKSSCKRCTEESDNEVTRSPPPPPPAVKKPTKSKWEGEDEEDDGPVVRSTSVYY